MIIVFIGNGVTVQYLKKNNYKIDLNRGAIKENKFEPKVAYGCTRRTKRYII